MTKFFKVEIEEKTRYVFDVKAETEAEAQKKGEELFDEACKNGTYHYHETGDTESYVSTVYDVTGTDDEWEEEEIPVISDKTLDHIENSVTPDQ